MAKTIFEELGGKYERQGDYLIPCLTVPAEEEQPIGTWGQRHLDYLKQYRKVTYTNLLTMSGCPHGGISLNGGNPQWKRSASIFPHGSINWAADWINSMKKSYLPSPTSTLLTLARKGIRR